MIIEFTNHGLIKLQILKSHGVEISQKIIEESIKNPDIIELSYKKELSPGKD